MAMRQTLACTVSLALLTAPLWGASSAPLGVVTATERAQLRSLRANTGDTVFDGDTLSTDKLVGVLRVRATAAQFQLLADSSATVTQTASGIRTTLKRGTEIWSAARAGAIELHASQARIRSLSDGPTVAQVTLVSPKELLVTARRGVLEITVEDETQIVPEATSYRVLLDPPDPQQPQGAGTKPQSNKTPHAGRNRFMLIPLIPIAVATVIAVHEAWESPSSP
jgi:hypothetical protein